MASNSITDDNQALIRENPENDPDHEETRVDVEFSSYYSATIFMFALGSTGVALALVPLLLFNDEPNVTAEQIYHFLKSVCFLALIILSGFLLWYKRRIISQGYWTHTNPQIRAWLLRTNSGEYGLKQAKYMMFTLVVFGTGSIIWCVIKMILEASSYYDYINNILNILSLCIQLFFFYDYISETLPDSRALHYAIASMIGIKMWSWIGAILEPLWNKQDFLDANNSIITGTEDFLEFSEEFFEPFYVEFSTIAVGVLFSIWHSMRMDTDTSSNTNNHLPSIQNPSEYTSDVEYSLPPSNLEAQTTFSLVPHKKSIILLAALTGIVFTVVSSLATVDDVIRDLTTRVYIYRGVTLLFFTILLGVAIILLFRLSYLPSYTSSFLNSNENVLLFTACSESIYYILRAVAAIGFLATDQTVVELTPLQPSANCTTLSPLASNTILTTKSDSERVYSSDGMAALFLVYAFVKFTEAWVQSRLLIVARRKIRPAYVKHCLTFFVTINISEWLKSGILLGLGRKHRSNFNPMMDAFYGSDETIIIILVLLPIMILFRFHAAIVALEIINES